MSILLIIMYIININHVQYFTFVSIENIKHSYRNHKIHLSELDLLALTINHERNTYINKESNLTAAPI